MDRTFAGIIAGITGGIIMSIWSEISFSLGITSYRYLDWSSVMVYGTLPQNVYEAILAQIMQTIWSGFLGVLFAFILPVIGYKGQLLKGIFYGILLTFFLYAIPSLFQIPYLSQINFHTFLSNTTGSVIFGFVLAYVLSKIEITES